MWLNELYQHLDPVAVSFGPFAIRWYGLAYLAGFLFAAIIIYRTQRRWGLDLTVDDLISIMTGIMVGVILGGRLGYVVFYGKGWYLQHPLDILKLYEGGMSFHGGLIGAIVGAYVTCRQLGISFATIADLAACGGPVGLFLGRCANFVNGELWGKETTLPWGVMFANTGGGEVYRHPSQLYEAILEGLVIFLVLYALSRKVPPRPQGFFLGMFLTMYGCFRFLIEFVRLPDAQMGYLLGTNWLTMGQCLSLPLVVIGIGLVLYALRADRPQRIYL